MSATDGSLAAQAPYLAREAELERIQHHLEQAASGRGGLVVLRGPSGMGVTRTAHEAAARADRLGMIVLWGRWFEGTCGRPYGALSEAFEEWAGGVERAVLASALTDHAPPLVRLAPRLSQSLSELRPAAPLAPADEWLRLRSAFRGWLTRAAANQPLLLVLDDGQWADADSRHLLEHVGGRLDSLPLLLLVGDSYLPADDGSDDRPLDLAPLAELPSAEVIELPGLDVGATAAAIGSLVDQPLSERAIALIQEVTGGHPLWARELLRHLHAEDRLDDVHGRGLPAAAELPETFEQLVAWRISRLGPEVRAALTTLAAFHNGAPPNLLAEVSGLSRSRLVEFLEVAVRHGLARASHGGQGYIVAHDRLRMALLQALSAAHRAQLHRRLADVLEADLGGRAREHAGELLFHHHRSVGLGRAQRGVRHAIVAAEQARAAYSFERAGSCLEAALEMTEDRRGAAELLSRLAQARAEAGLPGAAASAADEALRSQRQVSVPASVAVDQLVTTLRVLRRPWTSAPATQHEELRRLGLEYAGRVDPLTRARLELLGEAWQPLSVGAVSTQVWSSAPAPAVRPLRESSAEADLAELLEPQRVRTRDETAQAARHARAWRQPAAVLRAMRAVVVDLLTRHGLFREAGSWAGMYLTSSQGYGSPRDIALAHVLRGRCQAVLGYFAEAGDSIEATRALLDELPDDRWLAAELLLTELVRAYYTDGKVPELAERGGSAEGSPFGLAVSAARCLAAGRAGDEEGARRLLPDVLEACAQLPPLAYYRDAALIDALGGAWELGAAEYSARGRALIDLAIAGQVGTQASGSLRQAKGRMYALAGDVDEARSYFADERPALEAAELRPLRAIIDHDEALALAAAGAAGQGEAATLLERAAEQFEALAMSGWLERTRSLLEDGLEAALRPGGRLHFTYPEGLSRREADVVRLLSDGTSLSDSAAALGIDEDAVTRHLATAMDKLGVSEQADLPRAARRHGLGGGV